MLTRVTNIYKDPDYDVYIGRPGKGQDGYFGNPFKGSNRDQVIAQYKEYFYDRLKKDPEFRHNIRALKGKILGCFCKPKACHGDVIAEYLNRLPEIKPIKLAVVGGRNFCDYEFMKNILQWYDIKLIVSGGACGADKLSERYAMENSIPTKIFPAEWEKHGKRAGYLRNVQIVDHCDEVAAFWDGQSRGTKLCIKIAKEAGKPVSTYWPQKNEDPLLDMV